MKDRRNHSGSVNHNRIQKRCRGRSTRQTLNIIIIQSVPVPQPPPLPDQNILETLEQITQLVVSHPLSVPDQVRDIIYDFVRDITAHQTSQAADPSMGEHVPIHSVPIDSSTINDDDDDRTSIDDTENHLRAVQEKRKIRTTEPTIHYHQPSSSQSEDEE